MGLVGQQTGRLPECKPLQTTSFRGAVGTFRSLDGWYICCVWLRFLQIFHSFKCSLSDDSRHNFAFSPQWNFQSCRNVQIDISLANTSFNHRRSTLNWIQIWPGNLLLFSNGDHHQTADFHTHAGLQRCTPGDLVVLLCGSLHGDVPGMLAVTDCCF